MARSSGAPGERLRAAIGAPGELVLLPLPPEGEWLSIRDSHDVSGFNDDGFTGTYSYQYKTEQGWVLFDHKGPGCIVLLRTIGFKGRLLIYVDRGPEEGEPRWSVAFGDLYSGAGGRGGEWPSHLVVNMEKGHGSEWCYRPIPFLKRCVVLAQEEEGPAPGPHFYTIWAQLYRPGEESDRSIAARLPRLASGWSDPVPREPLGQGAAGRRETGRGIPEPWGRLPLFECRGEGVITSLALRPADAASGGGASADAGFAGFGEAALRRLFLRARWDAAEDEKAGGWESGAQPDVDAPIGLFFAKGYSAAAQSGTYTVHHEGIGDVSVPLGAARPRSIAVGEAADGRLYCRFPMPFWKNARVELVNLGARELPAVQWEIAVEENPYPADAGHFRALYRRENGTLDHRDYVVARLRGRGRFVGCVMRMSSRQDPARGGFQRGFLEGDARFYLDGKRSFEPASTGTEEYFNWGWYDMPPHDAPFSFPTHGYTEHTRRINDHTTMYRLHYTDGAAYYRSLSFEIEHGPHGTWPSDYESVAFLYHRPEPALFLTDHIDIGSRESREAHAYRADGVVRLERRALVYEGNAQVRVASARDRAREDATALEAVVRDVEAVSAGARFSAAIRPDNTGVKLRKCLDGDRPAQRRPPDPPAFIQVVPAQEAAVAVDGREVGVWYIAPRIARSCWIEEDFEIPRRFTQGRERISVSLKAAPGSEWSAAAYWIFSYGAGGAPAPSSRS